MSYIAHYFLGIEIFLYLIIKCPSGNGMKYYWFFTEIDTG